MIHSSKGAYLYMQMEPGNILYISKTLQDNRRN